jgi:endonuclease/exonuclease/phosphatase family metal-dependent hydrolase
MRLRILTLNCWNVSPPFEERMAVLHAGVAALAPDVIGFQEIVVRRDGFDEAAIALAGLGYAHVFGAAFRWTETARLLPPDHPGGDAFGNAIASRWPIGETVLRPLPGSETDERRSVLAARIATPAGTLPVLTTHLNWKPEHGDVRERQVVAVADVVAEVAARGTLPPVLVGDLNAEPGATEIRFLCGDVSLEGRTVRLEDAWRRAGDGSPGFTWDNRNPYAALAREVDRRIDYVLLGGGTTIESARLAFTEAAGGIFASDHFGVVVDLQL